MVEAPHSRARGWVIVFVLAAGAMVSSLQFTLTVPILPELPDLLDISISDSAWVIIATLLSSTVSTPIMSRMADLYGRKRILLIALGLLCLGSLIAAIGMTFFTIIIGRILQGFATSVVPIGISLIHSHVAVKQANMGVALMSGTIGMGTALGLPLSGVLMESVGLSGIFWISAFASAFFLALVTFTVPEAKERLNKSFDPFGTLLLITWLTSLMLVISKGAEWSWLSLTTITWTAMFAVGFALWVRLSLRNPNAVIDIRLATRPMMLRINAASFLATFGMFVNHLMTIQEARAPKETGIGLELPLISAGLVLLPFAVAMMVLTPVTGWSINRFGPRVTLAIGSGVMALGFGYRVFMHGGLAEVIIGTLIVGFGTSFAFAAMPALVTQASPAAEHASANGVNALVRSLSGAIASSVYALVLIVFPSVVDPQYLSEPGLMVTFGVVGMGCLAAASIALIAPRHDAFSRTYL